MKIFLFAITLIVLAAVTATFVVGIKYFDGVVTEEPYAAGIRWDETRKAAAALGWHMEVLNTELHRGGNLLLLSVRDRSGGAHTGTVTALHRTRPSTNRYDRHYSVAGKEKGALKVPLDFPLPGRWILQVDVASPAGMQTLSREVFVVELPTKVDGGDGKTVEVDCDFVDQPCTAVVGSEHLRITLEVEPAPPETMQPLRFRVRLEGEETAGEVEEATLSFFMPGMFMGPNRTVLKKAAPGIYTGEGLLPRCASGKKGWGARVGIRNRNREDEVRFLFEVVS